MESILKKERKIPGRHTLLKTIDRTVLRLQNAMRNNKNIGFSLKYQRIIQNKTECNKIVTVSTAGTIMRKLPRKVDVLEGENAAFCVEVEKEEMDIHWYKDGIELRETHQTILKSFGRTHILVFVNTMPEDSGLVTFLVGRSKTSSQLRVKGKFHKP